MRAQQTHASFLRFGLLNTLHVRLPATNPPSLPQYSRRHGIRLLGAIPPPEEYLPMQWSPFSILEVFSGDPLLLR